MSTEDRKAIFMEGFRAGEEHAQDTGNAFGRRSPDDYWQESEARKLDDLIRGKSGAQ